MLGKPIKSLVQVNCNNLENRVNQQVLIKY